MNSRAGEENHWGFEPVIDLIRTLSIGGEGYDDDGVISRENRSRSAINPCIEGEESEQERQLGDFDSIWRFLGQPLNVAPPQVPPESSTVFQLLGSTGSNEQSPLKAVKWRDELEGGDLADNDEGNDVQDLSGLNKQQRKKARRRQRREALAAGITNGANLPSGSENDSEKESKSLHKLDSKGVIYELLHGHPPKDTAPQSIVSRLRSGKVYKVHELLDLEKRPVASPESAKQPTQILKPPKDNVYVSAAAKTAKLMALLHESFINERIFLNNISYVQNGTSGTNDTGDGIHVFVDASNVRPLRWLLRLIAVQLPSDISNR